MILATCFLTATSWGQGPCTFANWRACFPNYDQAPTVRVKTAGHCNDRAKSAGVEGTSPVFVIISTHGDVTLATVQKEKQIGYGLDEIAIRTVKKWKFNPALKDKKPVRSAAMVNVEFACR